MTKERVPIPDEISDEVMFLSHRTCCICRERGRQVQIHHIDDDPSNNEPANLAVLCLLCHDDTQLKGGFGRKLGAGVVKKYRDEWVIDVKNRKEKASEVATKRMAPIPEAPDPIKIDSRPVPNTPAEDPINLILRLPSVLAAGYEKARPEWDSGVKSRVMQASYDLIDVLEEILVRLASYYPANHFDKKSPSEYFSAYVSSRFEWHRARYWVYAPEQPGTIIGPLAAGSVLADLEHTVEEIVVSLHDRYSEFSFQRWKREWNQKA